MVVETVERRGEKRVALIDGTYLYYRRVL